MSISSGYNPSFESDMQYHSIMVCLCVSFAFSSLKNIEYHQPGGLLHLLSNLPFRSLPLSKVDVDGKTHSFTLAPHAGLSDLSTLVSLQTGIHSNEFFFTSDNGYPLNARQSLFKESHFTVFMHYRLQFGGIACCIKGCPNEGSRGLSTMMGCYEIKCNAQAILSNDIKTILQLKVCHKHYSSTSNRRAPSSKG